MKGDKNLIVLRSAPPGRKASLASLPSIPLRFMLGYFRPLPTGARSQASTPYGSKKQGAFQHFRKGCRPEFHRRPTLSAEKSGKDGARKSIAKAKMLYCFSAAR
jgi:hypothetical protein